MTKWLISADSKLTPTQHMIIESLERLEKLVGVKETVEHEKQEEGLSFEEHVIEELDEIIAAVGNKSANNPY